MSTTLFYRYTIHTHNYAKTNKSRLRSKYRTICFVVVCGYEKKTIENTCMLNT